MRRVVTEEEFTQLVKNRDRGTIDRARTGVGVEPQRAMTRERAKNIADTVTPSASPSKYRSKWEEQMAYELTLEKRVDGILDWGYETMTLKLGGGHYHRPDFTVWHLDHHIELRQVKGYHKNIRAAMVGLKWAAQKHPWFTFTLWRRSGQGWESERVEA